MDRLDKVNRIDWIDTAKGIGIIIVVLGHNRAPQTMLQFIYAFHMPLFFFLSGIVFNIKKYSKLFDLVKRKFKTLIIPYIVFNLITYAYWIFISQPERTNDNVIKPIIGIIFGYGPLMIHNSALWFLTCLFFTEILFYFIVKAFRKNINFVLFVIMILGYICHKMNVPKLPWNIDIVFTTTVFYGVGYLIKGLLSNLKNTLLIIIVSLTYVIAFSKLNSFVDLSSGTYGNMIYFYLGAISGIALIIALSQALSKLEILKVIGRNSVYIFGLHILSLRIFFDNLGFGLETSLIESILCTIGEIALLIPLIISFNYLKEIVFKSNYFKRENFIKKKNLISSK